MEQLRKEFEKIDPRKDGKCDPLQFKKVLTRFGVSSGVNNVIKRFSSEGFINYNDFLGYFEESRANRKSTTKNNQDDITPSPQQFSPRAERPSPIQKPKPTKVESIDSKLYTLRTNIEKDLKQIDKDNVGFVPVENFKEVLGKCFENPEVIKSIVRSVSNGNKGMLQSLENLIVKVNYEIFLSLISTPPSTSVFPKMCEDQIHRSDRKVFNHGSKMLNQFMSLDPLKSGFIEESHFNNAISKFIEPQRAERIREKVAQHTFEGKVDYNRFLTTFTELSKEEEEQRGIRCFPRPPSCILDSNITKPNLKGLATFPKIDSLGNLLSSMDEQQIPQSFDPVKPSPTFFSQVFAPPDSVKQDFEQKDIVLQFSEYDSNEVETRKGKKFISPTERDERSPRKRQITGAEKESEENPLSKSPAQSSYEKLMETKKNDMRDGLRKVKDVFKKNKNISTSLNETLDGLGQLSSLEFNQILSKNGVILSEDQLDFVVKKCDRNGDGMLDYFDIANNLLHDHSYVNAFDSHLSLNGLVKDACFEPTSPRKQIFNRAQIQSPDFRLELPKQKTVKTLEQIQNAIANIDENLKTPVKLTNRSESEIPIQTPIYLSDAFSKLKDVIVLSPTVETPRTKQIETPKTQNSSRKNEFLSTPKGMKEANEVDKVLVQKISQKIKSSKSMKQAFQHFDKDRDGNISVEEFMSGLSEMGFNVSKSEASQMVSLASSESKLSYAKFTKFVEDAYWEKFPENRQPSPLKSSPKKVVNRSEEIVNKKIRTELTDYNSMKPSQIRESMRSLDKDKNSWLPPDKFKKALKSVNPNLPEWMVDRAVRQSMSEVGKCDYNKFFESVGFDLPNDEIEFKNQHSIRNSKGGSTIDLSDIQDPLLSTEITNFGRTTKNSITNGSGDIIAHTSSVRGDYPLEKHLGRKSCGKPIPDSFFVSDMEPMENSPQTPRKSVQKEIPSPTTLNSSPRTGRFSSTPLQRNPLFGEEVNNQKQNSIKVGYTPTGAILSNSQLRTNYEKKGNLSKGLATFVSERVESPKKVIRQLPHSETKKTCKKLYNDIRQQTEISIERGSIDDEAPISPRNRNPPTKDTKQTILLKVEEHHKTARDAFRKISSVGDDITSVTVNEMQKALKDMNVHISRDELKKTFEVSDNKEKINFEKFASVIKPPQSESMHESRCSSPPVSPRGKMQNKNQSSLKELLSWDIRKAEPRSQSVPTKKDVCRGNGNIITWM